MRTKSIGIALIVIGILMTIYTGFNYVTREKVVDIGPLQISKEDNNPVQWSPIIGLIVLVGGVIVIEDDRRRRKG
jgi:uncharacterized membrane protein YdcZ (DUF606 family)